MVYLNNVDILLGTIREIAITKNLSDLEKKRLLKDLETVRERLRKREYKKTGFSENKFNIPNRAQELNVDLQFYSLLGKTWAQILKPLNIHRFKQIVDFCPGYAPKIELALYYLDYSGEVIVIDKNLDSIKMLQNFMDLFKPKYKLSKRIADVFTNFKDSYQLVIANHVIDDLILYYFSKKFNLKLDDIYTEEQVYVEIWGKILKNKSNNQKEISPVLTNIFKNIVKSGGTLCIAHYPSYMEKILDLRLAARFNEETFKRLAQNLLKNGFEEINSKVKLVKNTTSHFGSNNFKILKKSSGIISL